MCKGVKIRDLNKQIKEYEEKSTKLSKAIQDLKDMIAIGDLSSTPGYNELTEDEQKIIVKGMDKTDYSMYSDSGPRWYDLERLINEVLNFKSKYPDWILKSIIKSHQSNLIPPQNNYKLTYLSSYEIIE